MTREEEDAAIRDLRERVRAARELIAEHGAGPEKQHILEVADALIVKANAALVAVPTPELMQ